MKEIEAPKMPASSTDLLANAISYKLPWSRIQGPREEWMTMEIHAVKFGSNGVTPNLWCIRELSMVLAKDGEWEWEPRPSMRDDDFIKRTRFTTAIEAAEFAKSIYG